MGSKGEIGSMPKQLPNAKYNSSEALSIAHPLPLQSSERAEDIKVSIDCIQLLFFVGWGAQSPRDLPS